MSITVDLPDGSVAEFPDGTSPAVMKAAIAKKFSKPSAEPKADPTEGMGTMDRYTTAIGRSIENTGRGAAQILPQGAVDFANELRAKIGLTPSQNADEAAKYDAPLLDTPAGFVGNIAGNMAQLAAPGAGATKAAAALGLVKSAPYAAGAATGAMFGAMQPTVGDESRAGNVAKEAMLGAGGALIGQGVGALARGGKEALSPAVKALAQKADAYGIPLTVAQLSDSAFVKTLQSALSKLPFSGQGKLYETQQAAFNRAIAKTFGEDADAITSDVAAAAKRRIGAEFDRLTTTNNLPLSQPLVADIGAVVQKAAQNATPENAALVAQQAEALIGKSVNGVVPGQAYREMDSQLGRLMKGTQDGDRKFYLGQLRDALRNGMDSAISPADQLAWKAARGQYRNLKTVEDLVEKAPTGNLSPALLMGKVRANSSDMAYGGGGDLADLARIGQQFLKAQVPDSGTAQRNLVYELTKAGGAFGGGAVAGVDPLTVLSMLALGKGASTALNSRLLAKYAQQGAGQGAQNAASAIEQSLPLLLSAYGAQ